MDKHMAGAQCFMSTTYSFISIEKLSMINASNVNCDLTRAIMTFIVYKRLWSLIVCDMLTRITICSLQHQWVICIIGYLLNRLSYSVVNLS